MDVGALTIERREGAAPQLPALLLMDSAPLTVVRHVPLTDMDAWDGTTKRAMLLTLAQQFWGLVHRNARLWLDACGDKEFRVQCEVTSPHEVCVLYQGAEFKDAVETMVDAYLYLEDRKWTSGEFIGIYNPIDINTARTVRVTGVTHSDVTRDKVKGT